MRTLAEECFERLRDAIVEGKLRPGDRLTMERLRERLGVGLSPIREALMQLERTGLVEGQSHKGFAVRDLNEAEVRDLYHTVFAIEALALEQAIARGDADWEADVARALYQLGKLETTQKPISYGSWAAANNAFHRALVAGCGSPNLLESRDRLWVQFDRVCRLAFASNREPLTANHKKHQELADAVLKRDAPLARARLRHHVLGSIEAIIVILREGDLL